MASISSSPITQVVLLQVFPPRAAGSRPPVLLQTLEAQLLEATNTAARAASAGPHQQRDPQLAANLSLDCHRRVSRHIKQRIFTNGIMRHELLLGPIGVTQ